MIDRTLKIIPVGRHDAVTAMTVQDLLECAMPARFFLPKAKLNPLDKRAVDRLRDLHEIIQRDFAGQKRSNARGNLADYLRDEWMPADRVTPPSGFIGPFILYFPDGFEIDADETTAHIRSKGIFVDGESRGEGLLWNVERLTDTEVEHLLRQRIAVHVIHGIEDATVIRKYFTDVNGKGVRVNPNLTAMADYTDPYTETTKRVFDSLGLELENRQRQVPTRSAAVLTGIQARTMVAAVARGISAVGFGAKPMPTDDVDFRRLESAAKQWLGRLFSTFDAQKFRDKQLILRAVPVSSSLAALGKAFYDRDDESQDSSLDVLSDDDIDWSIGPHWHGIAGRVNPNTNKFAVGGGKEYAYATHRALTKPGSDQGRQIRGLANGARA